MSGFFSRKHQRPSAYRPRLEILEDRLTPAVATWTGAVSTAWSDARNWSPNQRPGIGDDLIFPENALNKTNVNDLGNGRNYGSISFTGSGYTLTGNRIEFNRDTTVIRTNAGLNFINLPINFDFSYFAVRFYVVDVGTNGTLVINGVISGGLTEDLLKIGNGNLILNASNTYTMSTLVDGGTITVQNGAWLGSSQDLGGTILGDSIVALQNNITVPEDFFLIPGAFLSSPSGNNTITGAVTLSGVRDLTVAAGSRLTISGEINDDDITPAEGGWRKGGLGELVLTAANTNSEDNIVEAGQVTIQNNAALGNTEGKTTVNANAILAASGNRVVAEKLELDGADVAGGAFAELAALNGNLTWTGLVNPKGNARFHVIGNSTIKLTQGITLSDDVAIDGSGGAFRANGIVDFAGGIDLPLLSDVDLFIGGGATLNVSGGLRGSGKSNIKADAVPGGGRVVMGGPGAYTHTGTIDVVGAVLEANATLASQIAVNGGTLRGLGTVADINAVSGRVDPGTDENGRLSVANNFTIGSAATFQVDLAASNSDQLRVTGHVDLQDAILNVRDANGTPVGASFRIIDNLGNDDVEGNFEDLDEGDTFIINSANGPETFAITYEGGDGNDVVITRVNTGTMAPGIAVTPTAIDEGGVVHLIGHLVDPDRGDRLTLVVNWGDGTVQTFRPGLRDFDIKHQYRDNPQSAAQYLIQASWFDNHGAGNSRDLPVSASNVDPLLTVDVRFAGGRQVFVTGRIVDPGRDSFTLVVHWGDGQSNTYQFKSGTQRFQVQHRYQTSSTYSLGFELSDDDGGTDTDSWPVRAAERDAWLAAWADLAGERTKVLEGEP